MKPQDVALWLGLASTVGGAAIGYGTLTEKVATLEKNNAPTQLEARLVKLETRIEDNDIGRIGKEIQELRGEVERVSDKVLSIRIPETGKLETKVSVLETKIEGFKRVVEELNENPLK